MEEQYQPGLDIEEAAERFGAALVSSYALYQADDAMTRRFSNALMRYLDRQTDQAFIRQVESRAAPEGPGGARTNTPERGLPPVGAYIAFLSKVVSCFGRGDAATDLYVEGGRTSGE